MVDLFACFLNIHSVGRVISKLRIDKPRGQTRDGGMTDMIKWDLQDDFEYLFHLLMKLLSCGSAFCSPARFSLSGRERKLAAWSLTVIEYSRNFAKSSNHKQFVSLASIFSRRLNKTQGLQRNAYFC